MTSTSARRIASAIASHPVASCSVSTSLVSRGLTSTAISPSPRARPSASPRAPLLPVSLLAAEPLVARSLLTPGRRCRVRRGARVLGRGRCARHLSGIGGNAAHRLEPLVVAGMVLLPELPFVVVVLEFELVDHDDAVLHRAHLRADAAADARFVDHLVVALRRDLEALVGAVEPAHRALDARVEIHHGAQRPRRVLLVLRIALARLARFDDDARTHRRPARLL